MLDINWDGEYPAKIKSPNTPMHLGYVREIHYGTELHNNRDISVNPTMLRPYPYVIIDDEIEDRLQEYAESVYHMFDPKIAGIATGLLITLSREEQSLEDVKNIYERVGNYREVLDELYDVIDDYEFERLY